MKLLLPALSLAIILLVSGVGLHNSSALSSSSVGLEQPEGTDFPVNQGQTIVFTGQLISSSTLQGLPNATINIIQQVSYNKSTLLVSDQTDEDGFYSIPWTVDVELIVPKEGGSFGTEGTQGRELRFQVNVIAKFAGDDRYTQAVSNAKTFEVRLNALKITLEKESSYLVNESATIRLLITTALERLIDPDTITARFNNNDVELMRQGIGIYSFTTPSLTPGQHQFTVLVEKPGYTPDDELISIEALKRQTMLSIAFGKSSYALGEMANIFVSLADTVGGEGVSGKVMNGALTSPDLAVRQITFVDDKASYKLLDSDPTGEWTVNVSFNGDAAYFGSTTAGSFEVTPRSGVVTTPPPPQPPAPPAEEKVSLARPALVDQIGNPIDDITVGQQVMVQAGLTSKFDTTEELVYITQIKDSDGVTVALSWIIGTLSAKQALELAVSWMPDAPGEYTAEVFVWKSIKDPQPLSFEPKTIQISVS